MSINNIANIAAAYSNAMNATGARMANPEVINDTGKLAMLQKELMLNQAGYQIAAQAMKDEHQMNQLVAELLRDT